VVEYERTFDDLIKFNLFHIEHSPTIQRQVLLTRILTSILTPIFSLAVIYILDRDKNLPLFAYIISLIGGVVLFFVYPYINRSTIIRRTSRLLSEGSNKAIIGKQQITTSDEGLVCETQAGNSRINWSSIEKVVQNDEYIFLYVGATNAIVIPKRAFPSFQDQSEFLDVVNTRVNRPTSE
jgi:hypothetical protein